MGRISPLLFDKLQHLAAKRVGCKSVATDGLTSLPNSLDFRGDFGAH